MTPSAARASYRRQLAAHGQTVSVRRGSGGGQIQANALARIVGWSPEELASGLMQGERKAIVLAEDLERAGFPVPIERGDGIHVDGRRLNVESVDDMTRRVGSTVIAYQLGVMG